MTGAKPLLATTATDTVQSKNAQSLERKIVARYHLLRPSLVGCDTYPQQVYERTNLRGLGTVKDGVAVINQVPAD